TTLFRSTGAQTCNATVLEPVVAQLLTNELRVGLDGIGECAGQRDPIVVDPIERSRCHHRTAPAACHPCRGNTTRLCRNLEHTVTDPQISDVAARHASHPAIDRGE